MISSSVAFRMESPRPSMMRSKRSLSFFALSPIKFIHNLLCASLNLPSHGPILGLTHIECGSDSRAGQAVLKPHQHIGCRLIIGEGLENCVGKFFGFSNFSRAHCIFLGVRRWTR